MVSARETLAVCLNGSLLLLLRPSSAFTAPADRRPLRSSSSSSGPLHSFEVDAVVSSVAAAEGAFEAVEMSAGSAYSAADAVNAFFQTQPYLAGFLTCSAKASAADMIAQTRELGAEVEGGGRKKRRRREDDRREEEEEGCEHLVRDGVDLSRNLGFLFYGGMYQGMAQNYLYNVLYPSWFGAEESFALVAKEVLVDNLVFAPLLCLPVAYVFKAAFASSGGGGKNEDEPLGWDAVLREGLDRYASDVTTKGLLVEYWKVWFPANVITFGVIPSHYRVVFVAAISFFWVCVLSSISSGEEATTTPLPREDDAEFAATVPEMR